MFENYTVDLFDTMIQLRDGRVAEPANRRDALPGAGNPGLWTMGAFHADGDRSVHADVWERHPAGHEVLCVLSGQFRVYLRDHGDGSEPVAHLSAGGSFIVPPGRWHRLSVVEPGDLLSITPRPGTEHEKVGGRP
jgi:mannose-6-phosphate isomerase-like protein (cupin superfamily)